MKKALLILSLCFVLPCLGGVAAQEIKASSLEGCWIWDGKGEEPYDKELVFIGNVMLSASFNELFYQGVAFTLLSGTIDFMDGEYEWQYRLSGNTLAITDDYDDNYKYTRAENIKSPIEGIWKLTGGTDYMQDEDRFMIFTRDIMAFSGQEYEYHGFKVEIKGNTISPSSAFLEDDGISEGVFSEMVMGYRISGRTLTISVENESNTLTKVY